MTVTLHSFWSWLMSGTLGDVSFRLFIATFTVLAIYSAYDSIRKGRKPWA